jgi:spore coat polysaccharide biosynthesis protein SpsF (cytidylyltransferase family)/aryl-alcohol dehydrogenase-like predicted oxidoreductase
VNEERRVRVILQARTSSRRLPAKVLLPLGGLPLAILCAKRLGNTGRQVVLATSVDETDDPLAWRAASAGIKVCRATLDDVLTRFVVATKDLSDNDIVVRATADNPLPDGGLVDALVEHFLQHDLAYLGTNSLSDGLPYGLSAEVCVLGALRQRANVASTSFEREHVTSALRENSPASRLLEPQLLQSGNYAHLSCSVDTLADYLHMARLFDHCDDPVAAPWQEFMNKLRSAQTGATIDTDAKEAPKRIGVITLGTAQLGTSYGIANKRGLPSDRDARAIIECALSSGISSFDTARSYGCAESRLGAMLSLESANDHCVITKLAPMTDLQQRASAAEVVKAVEASVFHSCYALQRRNLDVVMFHRADDMFLASGAGLDHLASLAAQGVVREIGASVYSPDEAIRCLADERIGHIQIPFNLLDRRWTSAALSRFFRRRPNLRIHARSVFLQGLLVSDASVWPRWIASSAEIVRRVSELSTRFKRHGPADLCMAYVRAFPWVTTLVLGVDTRSQLEQLMEYAREPALSVDEVDGVQQSLRDIPDRVLDPRKW